MISYHDCIPSLESRLYHEPFGICLGHSIWGRNIFMVIKTFEQGVTMTQAALWLMGLLIYSFVNQCNSVNFSFAVLQWINMTEIEIKNPKILSILKKRLNNPVSDGTTDSLWRKNVTPSPGGISEKENNPVFHAYTTIIYFVSMSNKLSLTLHMVFIAVLINGGSATPEKNKHDVVQLYLGDKTVTSQLS